MAQAVIGKLLPNMKITLGNESEDAIIEEGEISDSEDKVENETNKKNVDIVRTWMQSLQNPKVYENKNGGFITGIDLSSEVLLKKLEERAERFGLEKKNEGPITQNEIDALYKSLGIEPENLNSCKLKNIRLDALHMRGVNEMNTNEIFKYFGEYGPASVEWINDISCNVVWLDEATTARAMLGKSQPLVIKKKDSARKDISDPENATMEEKSGENEAVIEMSDSEKSDDDDDRRTRDLQAKTETSMEVDATLDDKISDDDDYVTDTTSVDIPVPPGHWRLGVQHFKAKAILLRFATKDDKKLRGAEKRSQFYQKYGNPNYGGLKGLISNSRKRKMQAARNRQSVENITDESKPEVVTDADSSEVANRPVVKVNRIKMPRMRMYADDEMEKAKSGSFRRHNSEPKSGSIHSRLGKRYTKEDLVHLGSKFSSESEEDDDNISINCTVPSRYNVWTDIAKSMAKEDKDLSRNKSRDFEASDSNASRDLKSSRDYRSSQDLRSSLDLRSSSRDFRRSARDSRPPPKDNREPRQRHQQDLRRTLSSSISRARDNPSDRSQEDLRSKIKRLKKEDSAMKHRSPLCMDD